MNINLVIELKKEYETILSDILVPFVFEGIQSIYLEAKKIQSNNTLINFQNFLMKVKDWNINILTKELSRLETKQTTPQWFEKLIKAVLKINMLVLSLNQVPEHMLNDITVLKFLHQVYKECARSFWMNPFLFDDKVSSAEGNQNRVLSFQIISDCIKKAIHVLLPMNMILNKFLNITDETYTNSQLLDIDFSNVEFGQPVQTAGGNVSEIHLVDHNNIENTNEVIDNRNNEILNIINKNLKVSESPLNVTMKQNGGKENLNVSSEKQRYSQKYNSSRRDSRESSSSTYKHSSRKSSRYNSTRGSSRRESNEKYSTGRASNGRNSVENNSSSTLKKIINDSANNTIHKSRTATAVDELSIDSKIKQHLMKELESDTLTYNPENNNDDYQDVFSNSDVKEVVDKNNSKLKNKELFYNKYLDIE
jgi:septum formation topological specificity factor MinE